MIRFLQSGNKAAKYLLAGLLLILCVSMVAYLIPGFTNSSTITRESVVAKVGSIEVSTQDVQKTVTLMMQQAAQRNPNFPPEMMRPYFTQQAIPTLIRDAELRYESDRLGLSVSDQEVSDFLHSGQFGEMFFPKGQWVGQERYEQMVNQFFQTTVDDFERQLRIEMLRNKLISSVTAGVTVTNADVEKKYKEENTKVKFDYAVLNLDDLQKQLKPTDAELKAYYDTNKARYENSIPEKRQVKFFLITEQQAQSKVTVSPEEIEKYYRDNDAAYRVPDRVRVRHILIKMPTAGPDGKVDPKAVDAARAKAEDVLKQVKAGGDFAELAKKYSEDKGSTQNPGTAEKGGEIGWIVKGQTEAPFESVAFSMNKGQTSDLVQTSYGFSIVQTEDKETAHKKPLSEVKDDIEIALKQQKAAEWLQNTASAAANEAHIGNLEQTAAKYGAAVISTNPISRTDTLPGVGPAPGVMSTIFSTDEKAGVQSVQTPQGYAIFAVTKVMPSSTPAFEAIKDKVATDFKAERSSSLLSQKTAELSDRARSSHDLRKAAKEAGATVKTSELVDRNGQVPDVGAMTGQAGTAFTLKPGEISGPLNTGRKGIVLAITDRQEPALTGDEYAKAKDSVREELTQEKRQEAMDLFVNNLDQRLKKEGKVKTNQTVLEALLKNRG